LLATIVDVHPAKHLATTDTAAVFAAGIGYDRVHGCGRGRTARALNYLHPADFDFIRFLFPAYVCMLSFFRTSCQPVSLTLKL
jgi:hypothetical protein